MGFFLILASIKIIFLGAIYGRLDGGGIAKCGEWLERSLIMFFFVLACAPFAGYYALFAYLGVVGIATKHGQYFLDRVLKGQGQERVDPFVSLFFGKDWRVQFNENYDFNSTEKAEYELNIKPRLYLRNIFGMLVTGTLVGLPAVAVAICFGAWLPAMFFSLTGVVKVIGYAIGEAVWGRTEPAEYINGGLRNTLCLAAILATILA